MEQVSIIRPPEFVFQNRFRDSKQQIIMEHQGSVPMTHVEFPFAGGMYLHYENIPHLGKGFPYPEAMESVNIIKRLSMLFTSFSVNPLKWPEQILFNLCRVADATLNPHYLHIQYCTPCSRELWHFLILFFRKLGFNKDLSYRAARLFATLIEYDNAYRLRAQDMFSEVSKAEMLANPRKTIAKMMAVLREREVGLNHDEVGGKFLAIGKLTRIFLLIPKVKKAFRFALNETKFQDLQFDEADKYWCLNRTEYKYFGKPIKERFAKFQEIHKDKELRIFKPLMN